MKKLLLVFTALLLIMSFVGCDSEKNDGFDTAKMFSATVIEVNDGRLLVEPSKDCAESKSSDRIEVAISRLELETDINIGDTVEVYYDGVIQESYPAAVTKVVHVKKIEQ